MASLAVYPVIAFSPTAKNGRLCYAPNHKLNLRTSHLAAFQSISHLLTYSPSCPHASKKLHKPHIFLPHLVASLEVEETYIMIKPDGVQRGLIGEVISRFEKKGFKLKGLKLFQCPQELAQEHYKDLQSKPFFPKLINYITSGPVVCLGGHWCRCISS
ncbi:nucleoside diphosphate kinase 2, chloroplastic [Olea europaea subsp. europaea]|uniref:nucleoside-diphosphate kinase n=1 Tax=Olea europaea subsp. europaea TaxID=158383 RepID=A0A8S0VJH2_OLEEU|nr:nucleoside diphosphate kinase 2, chloroplastic [Olea europaea subsp. europaea]